jgi:multidrug efflux system membrane fusion protein
MVIETRKGMVLVPSAAIQRGNQGTIVYVVKDDSTVAIRTVVTGPTQNDVTAIESGLQAGERVIVDGVDRIREGVKVEVTEPGGGATAPRAPGAGKGDPAKREEFKKQRQESKAPQ